MSRYRRAPQVVETAIDDDLFLVAPVTQEIVHLDRMAVAIWRLLDEPRTAPDISAAFADAFPDVPHDQIVADIAVALDRLLEQGMIAKD